MEVISLVISQYTSFGCTDTTLVSADSYYAFWGCTSLGSIMTATSEFYFPVMAFEILVPAMLYFTGTKMAYIWGKISICSLQKLNSRLKHGY